MKKWVLSLVFGFSLAGLSAEFEFKDPSHFVAFYVALTSTYTQGTDNPSIFFSYKNDFYSEKYKDSVIEFDNTVKKIQEFKDDALSEIIVTYVNSLKKIKEERIKNSDAAIFEATDALFEKFKELKKKNLPKDIFTLSLLRLKHLKSYRDLKAISKLNSKATTEHWNTYVDLTNEIISFGETGKFILNFSELFDAAENRLFLRNEYDKWLLRYNSYEKIKLLSAEKLDELNEQTAKTLETFLSDKESEIYSPDHSFNRYLNLFIKNWNYIVKSEKHKRESEKNKDRLSIDNKDVEIIESIELKLDHRNDKSLEDIIFHSELEIIGYNSIRATICDNFSSKIKLAIIAAHKIELEKKRVEEELEDLRKKKTHIKFIQNFKEQNNALTNEENKGLDSRTLNKKGSEKGKLSQSFEYLKRMLSNQQFTITRSSSLPNGNLDGLNK